MARSTNILVAFIVALSPLVLAQDLEARPQVPEDALTTRQLIAWSEMQKPEPTPQPLPPRDTPIPQPDQSADQKANPPGNQSREQAPVQTFTGKIVKDGSKYSLRVGSKTYHVVEQDGLQKYEDQTVRIIGILDPRSDSIQVQSIDLIS